MARSRRDFLVDASLLLAGSTTGFALQDEKPKEPPAGMPPAFGTAPPAGEPVTPEDFAHAEKLIRYEMSEKERAQAAKNWRNSMAPLYERRTGPRKVATGPEVAPASRWQPQSIGKSPAPRTGSFVRSKIAIPPLPKNDADIAYAPVTHLSRWIEAKHITSERLTNIYLDRIAKYDGKLRCVITVTKERALAEARQADKEIAAGKYRGPLHG